MAKGFFRLFVVLACVSWIGAGVLTYIETNEDRWRLDGHLSPHLRGDFSHFRPTELDWPVYAASPAFLAIPLSEREEMARVFYEEHISLWEPFFHLDRLKAWILESSQYSLQEAPITKSNWNGFEVSFRDFKPVGILNSPRASYVFLNSNTLLIAAFSTVALSLIIAFLFFTLRWVVRGFRKG